MQPGEASLRKPQQSSGSQLENFLGHPQNSKAFERWSGEELQPKATVLVGFAKSYFLVGMIRAALPNNLIHIHAVFFSCWILLLAAQASLISAHRFDLRRKLGLFGFGLACGMIVVGVMAATDSMTRIQMVGPFDMRTFYAVPMFDVIVFAVLTFFAYRWRHDSATHKRLILIASIT